MKKINMNAVLRTIVCLLPVLAGIILYPKLPAQIATHWDGAGNVNGWSSKLVGAIIYPGILFLLNLCMPLLLKMDPKYKNVDRKVVDLILWVIPVVAVVCSGVTLANAFGKNLPVQVIIPALLGLMFIVIGNYLPKTKQSYTVGIKLPWTLNSEENWNRTHRLAGFLWVLCGFFILFAAFTPLRLVVTVICTVIMVGFPVVYSYLYYRKEDRTN